MNNPNIREANPKDAPFLLKMITELAIYENEPEAVDLTIEKLIQDGFNEAPLFKALILELNNKSVGMALYYNRYSTWKGKSLYLEDLYIVPEARGYKLGIMTMKYLGNIALLTECKRFEWQVLDWNKPSIKFYESLNADLDKEWINCRLEGEKLNHLNNKEVPE